MNELGQTEPIPNEEFEPEIADAADPTQDLEAICQCIGDLSANSTCPEGREPESGDLAEEKPQVEVFFSNAWIQSVLNVQHWLGLDGRIDPSKSPEMVIEALFTQIPPGIPNKCYTTVPEGFLRLTDIGIDRLGSRADKARDLRNEFLERLDQGATLSESTEEWKQAWDEINSQVRRPIADIHAEVRTWMILRILDYAKEGLLDLDPAWQRDVVWGNKDSQLLIESILRAIPLPSVILSEDSEGRFQIVDGKQRLTAILRFMGEHPSFIRYLRNKCKDNEEFEKIKSKFEKIYSKFKPSKIEIEENFLPYKLPKYSESDDHLKALSNRYYSQIKNIKIKHGGEDIIVSKLFESANSPYEIPFLIFSKTKIQDIHQIFSIYNKQGKKLNAEELRNAKFHHLHLSRLLMVLSGDRAEAKFLKELVPFLPEADYEKVTQTGKTLEERGFGKARFKRTKVLSWMTSILLQAPKVKKGVYSSPSTAGHIDAMLEAVEYSSSHPMYEGVGLLRLAHDLVMGVDAHRVCIDCWLPKLRNNKGQPSWWEELPLVAALLGMTILAANKMAALAEADIAKVRQGLSSAQLPRKVQNEQQWQWIAGEVLEMLAALDLDQATLGKKLLERYGYNCIETLKAIYSQTPEKDKADWFPHSAPVIKDNSRIAKL